MIVDENYCSSETMHAQVEGRITPLALDRGYAARKIGFGQMMEISEAGRSANSPGK